MLKAKLLTLCASTLFMGAKAQTPKLGVDPIEKVINAMTLDEKLNVLIGSAGNEKTDATATIGSSAELVPGAAGQLNAIPRLGIPATVVADGPAGLRIQPISTAIRSTGATSSITRKTRCSRARFVQQWSTAFRAMVWALRSSTSPSTIRRPTAQATTSSELRAHSARFI